MVSMQVSSDRIVRCTCRVEILIERYLTCKRNRACGRVIEVTTIVCGGVQFVGADSEHSLWSHKISTIAAKPYRKQS